MLNTLMVQAHTLKCEALELQSIAPAQNANGVTVSWASDTGAMQLTRPDGSQGTLEISVPLVMKGGKNITHGAGSSIFTFATSGTGGHTTHAEMSGRGFFVDWTNKATGSTTHRIVDLDSNDSTGETYLKLADSTGAGSVELHASASGSIVTVDGAPVKTKETRVLLNEPDHTVDQELVETLHDGGEYLIVSSNETFLRIGIFLELPTGAAYASARVALVLFKTGSNAGIDWSLTDPYWVDQADPTQSPTFDVASDTPSGYAGMIYHIVLERFGAHRSTNVAYKRPFQEPDLPQLS